MAIGEKNTGVDVSLRDSELGELEKKLYKLSAVMHDKIVGQAMYEGAEVSELAAKAKVPVRSGELQRSIARRKITRGDFIGARVLARRSSSFPGGYYSHLIERGHKIVRKVRGGRIVEIGYYSAHPFMRPAAEEHVREIVNIVKSEVRNGLTKEGF